MSEQLRDVFKVAGLLIGGAVLWNSSEFVGPAQLGYMASETGRFVEMTSKSFDFNHLIQSIGHERFAVASLIAGATGFKGFIPSRFRPIDLSRLEKGSNIHA